ncbi:hypothetical protein PINS_up013370 [Pythium insidiosum]|nr:hypothetical protein PINS_up013370 [Pythium insidiosum]
MTLAQRLPLVSMADDAECSVELSFSADDSDVISDADVVLVAHSKDQHKLATLLSAKHQELQQLQRTHDEFVRSSGEYEKELEAEVERLERRAQQLQSQLQTQDDAHARLELTLQSTQRELAASQAAETELRSQLQQLKRTIQRLEQTNDELETAQRVAQASLEELQHRLDVVTEENVFLQQERDASSSGRSSRSHSGGDPTVTPLPPSMPAASVSVSALQKILQTSGAGDADDALRRERRVSDATGPEPANNQQRKRKSGRYPEVVEACLHMTCSHSQCRRVSLQRLQQQQQQQQQQTPPAKAALQKASSDKKSAKRGFLERLRHRLFSV